MTSSEIRLNQALYSFKPSNALKDGIGVTVSIEARRHIDPYYLPSYLRLPLASKSKSLRQKVHRAYWL